MLALDDPGEILFERQLEFLDVIGAHVLHVIGAGTNAAPRAVFDVDGSIIGHFPEHGLRAVLVRPDNYIFGTVGDASEMVNSSMTLRGSSATIQLTQMGELRARRVPLSAR